MNSSDAAAVNAAPSAFRLLHIDIETRPALVYTWSLHKPEIGVEQIVSPTSLLCFDARWHGEDAHEFHKSVKPAGREYDAMVRAAHRLLTEADAVCHYNGVRFDVPRLNQEFLRLGLSPTPPIPQIDLWKVVVTKFDLISSKLAFVGPYLHIGEKIKHEGFALWIGCIDGDSDCWRRMEEYCCQDVALLPQLYERLLPWIDNHPNLGLYGKDEERICPNCGLPKLQSRGIQRSTTLTYKRFQCLACGHWCRARMCSKAGPRVDVR